MHPIKRRIDEQLRVTGQPPTRFGREALGDPSFVRDLKRGREPNAATVARVEAFIADREAGA